jgi:protein-S-isoprenylcysteine O-methyltransferase Ste14
MALFHHNHSVINTKMRKQEKLATIFTAVVMILVVGGMMLQSWKEDHDWRIIFWCVTISTIAFPFSVWWGRALIRGWVKKQTDKK